MSSVLISFISLVDRWNRHDVHFTCDKSAERFLRKPFFFLDKIFFFIKKLVWKEQLINYLINQRYKMHEKQELNNYASLKYMFVLYLQHFRSPFQLYKYLIFF